LNLVDKALDLKPDFYWYLDAKGWGLYKQGKYDEALKYIQKCIDLSPPYRHNVHLHPEAAIKAAAGQKKIIISTPGLKNHERILLFDKAIN